MKRGFDDGMKWPIRDISWSNVVNVHRHIQDRISKRNIQPLKANPRGLADATYSVTNSINKEDHTLPIASAVGSLFKKNKNDFRYLIFWER